MNKQFDFQLKKLYHIINNFTKNNIFDIIICYSLLEQDDIIYKTCEFYNKKYYIPTVKDIDNTALLIDISPYIFMNINKENLKNWKIFFTKNIENHLISIYDDFNDNVCEKNIDLLEYYNIEKYYITDNDTKILNKEISIFQNNNFEIMEKIQNNINSLLNIDKQ